MTYFERPPYSWFYQPTLTLVRSSLDKPYPALNLFCAKRISNCMSYVILEFGAQEANSMVRILDLQLIFGSQHSIMFQIQFSVISYLFFLLIWHSECRIEPSGHTFIPETLGS